MIFNFKEINVGESNYRNFGVIKFCFRHYQEENRGNKPTTLINFIGHRDMDRLKNSNLKKGRMKHSLKRVSECLQFHAKSTFTSRMRHSCFGNNNFSAENGTTHFSILNDKIANLMHLYFVDFRNLQE